VGFTAAFEGVVPWMYQDVKGLVTVAIGNLIDPMQYAMPLPFVDRVTGTPADRDTIMREWMRVKSDASLARLGHRAAERVTNLRLTPEGIDMLVGRKLEQNDSHLRGRFPDFESWPACAQLATHSMAWACGPGFRFDRLVLALRMQDFAAAALECHMNEAGNPGLAPRNRANKILYRNAERVRAFKLDPDTLEWEQELDVSGVPTGPLPEEVTGSGPILHVSRYEPEPDE
jgi:GH24 family phage-related lysozyme (muramidase)